jgi:hypothetical protein
MNEEKYNVKPNAEGEILVGSPMSMGKNSDTELYNLEIENYESHAKECWSIEEIPIKKSRACFSSSSNPYCF